MPHTRYTNVKVANNEHWLASWNSLLLVKKWSYFKEVTWEIKKEKKIKIVIIIKKSFSFATTNNASHILICCYHTFVIFSSLFPSLSFFISLYLFLFVLHNIWHDTLAPLLRLYVHVCIILLSFYVLWQHFFGHHVFNFKFFLASFLQSPPPPSSFLLHLSYIIS